MAKDWKEEFDDILRESQGSAEPSSGEQAESPDEPPGSPADSGEPEPADPEPQEPEPVEPEPQEPEPVEPEPREPEPIEPEPQEPEPIEPEPREPEPIPDEPPELDHVSGIPHEPDTAETELIGEILEEAPPPVIVQPENALDELVVEGPAADPRRSTGFGLAVEEMFHELVSQIGQVKEMARRKREEQAQAETDREEQEFLEEEESSFFGAVEKMFHDIRDNFSRRIKAVREQEKEVEEKLEKTRMALEIRQHELERLRHEMETAQRRTSELEQELSRLQAESASRVDEAYVQTLEERLNDAYGLLKTIEETYLAVEGGSF